MFTKAHKVGPHSEPYSIGTLNCFYLAVITLFSFKFTRLYATKCNETPLNISNYLSVNDESGEDERIWRHSDFSEMNDLVCCVNFYAFRR